MFDALHWARNSPPFLLLGAWLWGLFVCILNRRLSRWMNLLIAGFGLAAAVWFFGVTLMFSVGVLFSPSIIQERFFLTFGLGQVTAVGLIVIGLVFLFRDFRCRFEVVKDLLIRQSDDENEAQPGVRNSNEIQQRLPNRPR